MAACARVMRRLLLVRVPLHASTKDLQPRGVACRLGVDHATLMALNPRLIHCSISGYGSVGSMKEAKSQGVYRLEGKTYIVQDGDIMHILASG